VNVCSYNSDSFFVIPPEKSAISLMLIKTNLLNKLIDFDALVAGDFAMLKKNKNKNKIYQI